MFGAGGVGKSTVFKQMRLIYMGGFEDADRLISKKSIFENVLVATEVVGRAVEALELEFTNEDESYNTMDSLSEHLVNIRCLEPEAPAPDMNSVWPSVKALWKDPVMKDALKRVLEPHNGDDLADLHVEPSAKL